MYGQLRFVHENIKRLCGCCCFFLAVAMHTVMMTRFDMRANVSFV